MNKSSRRDFIKNLTFGAIGSSAAISLISCETDRKKEKEKDFIEEDPFADGIEIREGYRVFEPVTQMNMVALATIMVPGVENTDIRNRFMQMMDRNHGDAGSLDAGLWNLEMISRGMYERSFFKIEEKEHIDNLIAYLLKSNRSFFYRFRRIVVQLYYSHPYSWKKLSYSGPPQPVGFMDYAKAPKE